jgi:hypothetical protein
MTTSVRYKRALAAAGALALVTAGWLAMAPVSAGSREMVFVIPPGTAASRNARPVNVLPAEIHLTAGVRDVLVLTNDDSAIHTVGPIVLGSRQTYRIPFRRAGRFEFACSLHAAGRLTIVVAPEPSIGFERLRWRLARARL